MKVSQVQWWVLLVLHLFMGGAAETPPLNSSRSIRVLNQDQAQSRHPVLRARGLRGERQDRGCADCASPEDAAGESSKFCRVLGSPVPSYVAVVARWDEDVAWTKKMPMPVLIYEHAKAEALYNVRLNKGSETSSYLQFIIDHYHCLPRWVLFLHAHGRTAGSGSAHAAVRHHPTEPWRVAGLVDVDRLGRGFLGLGHFTAEDWAKRSSLHPAARAFSGGVPGGKQGHHAAFVPTAEGKRGCQCGDLKALLPGQNCGKPWSWNVGAEFWASGARIRARPREFWNHAMGVIMRSKDKPRFGHKGSFASEAGYCFESAWHALLGEPFYGYTPPFKLIEDLPLVPAADRCARASPSPTAPLAPGCATRSVPSW